MIDPAWYRAAMHPVRLPILLACSDGPCPADVFGLSETAARWHLGVLVDAGLLDVDGDLYRARTDWRPLHGILEDIVASGPHEVPADAG
jgi:DNA-binding transcriptional ArsR family regulator